MESREHERITVQFRAMFTFRSSRTIRLRAQTKDISRNGLQLAVESTSVTLPVEGAYVEAHVELPRGSTGGIHRSLHCQGNVVWLEPVPGTSMANRVFRVGIEVHRMKFCDFPKALYDAAPRWDVEARDELELKLM